MDRDDGVLTQFKSRSVGKVKDPRQVLRSSTTYFVNDLPFAGPQVSSACPKHMYNEKMTTGQRINVKTNMRGYVASGITPGQRFA
jgi:hypothetical protein